MKATLKVNRKNPIELEVTSLRRPSPDKIEVTVNVKGTLLANYPSSFDYKSLTLNDTDEIFARVSFKGGISCGRDYQSIWFTCFYF